MTLTLVLPNTQAAEEVMELENLFLLYRTELTVTASLITTLALMIAVAISIQCGLVDLWSHIGYHKRGIWFDALD